jgi:cytochrome c-type biogenesis protein
MADASPLIAFAAGLASFFAPCVLPVLPGYLSFISGGAAAGFSQRLARTGLFVLGLGLSFVAIGLVVGAAGASETAQTYQIWIRRIGGVLIITFGLVMTGLLHVSWLERDMRYHGQAPLQRAGPYVGAFAMGGAFAVGWSPCVGPILASILILAGTGGGLAQAALLLTLYSVGLAIPFLLLGISADRGANLLRRFRKSALGIQIAGGVILIILGIIVFTGNMARLTSLVLPGGPK